MSEVQTVPTPEAEPSYKRAARLIREKFAALGIVATFGAPVPKVEPAPESILGESHKPQPWAHVLFPVEFSRAYGSSKLRGFSTEYSIGTGLAPWKDAAVVRAAKMPHFGAFRDSDALAMIAERECLGRRPGSRYSPEIEAQAAAIACAVAKWSPDPAEIFAGICREGFEARDVSFEDWAEAFGFSTDSREGERIFNACRAQWANVLRLVSAADAEEFATLAGEL